MSQLSYLPLVKQDMATPRINNRTGISNIRPYSMLFNFKTIIFDFIGFLRDDGHHIPVLDVMVHKVKVITSKDQFCGFVLSTEVETEGLVLDFVMIAKCDEDLIKVRNL